MSKHPHFSFRVQKRNLDGECTVVCIAGSGESFIISIQEVVEKKLRETIVLDNKNRSEKFSFIRDLWKVIFEIIGK